MSRVAATAVVHGRQPSRREFVPAMRVRCLTLGEHLLKIFRVRFVFESKTSPRHLRDYIGICRWYFAFAYQRNRRGLHILDQVNRQHVRVRKRCSGCIAVQFWLAAWTQSDCGSALRSVSPRLLQHYFRVRISPLKGAAVEMTHGSISSASGDSRADRS